MQTQHPKTITEEQWLEAGEAFELGYMHGVDIAADLGVSPSTVSREFKRRGLRKGCRAWETVVELEAALDAKVRRRAAIQEAREEAAARRSAELDALMDELMRSLIAGSKKGDLSAAAIAINRVGKSLGVKLAR